MNQNICFNQTAFLSAIIIVTVIILLYNHLFNKCPVCKPIIINKNNDSNTTEEKTKEHREDNILVSDRYNNNNNSIVDKLIDYRDRSAVTDPLHPPHRRLPRHIYPTDVKDYLFETPTRGYPDNYHYYGNLIRRNDDKIVKLFGRQTYPGSNKYEYYGLTSDSVGGSEVKIPINVNGDKELYDKDQIDIDFLDTDKGNFILYMNDYDRPRYNPFVIN
jgi:hypothetical protein